MYELIAIIKYNTWASCSSFKTGLSVSASGSPMHFSIFSILRPANIEETQ